MTRADVAAVLGVHTNYVTRLLNAARAPWTLCKACGLARRHRPAERAA
jgi:plasmid maintenance system antidote protein VapI